MKDNDPKKPLVSNDSEWESKEDYEDYNYRNSLTDEELANLDEEWIGE